MSTTHAGSFNGRRAARRKTGWSRLALGVFLSLAGMAHADSGRGIYDYHLYGGGFYLFPDNDRTEEDGNFGWQINLGKRLSDRWWLEGHVFGDTIEQGSSAGTDFYQMALGADIQYAFGDRDEFTPFLLLGVGGVKDDVVPDSEDSTNFFANAGAGFTKRFAAFDLVRLRGEARVLYDDFKSGLIDYRVGLGIEIALGTPKSLPIPEEKVVIKEVPVEVEKIVIKEAPPPGNPDLDGDGVVNEKDKCPNTPAGAKVDGDGCVVEQVLVMKDVTFEFNSSRLTLNGQRLLESTVEFLKSEPNVNLNISGHTDNVGSAAYNLKLSKARANSVRDYLISKGISADRLQAAGFGKAKPIASNDTDAGREANRRVEFEIKKSAQ